MSDKPTVLAVDDDPRSLRLLDALLSPYGFKVVTAPNGDAAVAAVADSTPDIVLMDVMMPVMDGFAACKRIREFSQVPVIIVTARDDITSKTSGFDAGADDYVTKPYSGAELAARIKAVIRRALPAGETSRQAVFRLKDLTIDFGSHLVTIGNRELDITGTELRLVAYLAENAGRILTSDQILNRIWGEAYLGETHLLQATIHRLRTRLGDSNKDPKYIAKDPKYIATRHGIGYMMLQE